MSNVPAEFVPLDDLQSHPENPKRHDLDTLVDSIGRFGFVDPVVVDQRTGLLVGGHGRTEALRVLHATDDTSPPDGVRLGEKQKGGFGWLVPVYTGWASKDDVEARAALVALNRLTETGGWDERELLTLMEHLDKTDQRAGIGFVEEDLDVLRRRLEALDGEPLDPEAEWAAAGMPGYNQEDLESEFRVTVHFPTEEAIDEFFRRIDRDRTRSLWWPTNDGHKGCFVNHEWVAEDTDA